MSGEEDLGSGIALDESFDFEVSPRGDIDSVSGAEELNKDLAFQLNILLDEFRGQPLNNELKSNIKTRTIDGINSDVRVDFVRESEIQIRQTDRNTISLLVPYNSEAGDQELVFRLEK